MHAATSALGNGLCEVPGAYVLSHSCCAVVCCAVREAGKPLFVSLLLYLDKEWPRDADAETLFLDSPTDTGGCLTGQW